MENELEMTVVLHVIRSSAYISMSYTAEMGSSVRPCTQRHAVNGDIYCIYWWWGCTHSKFPRRKDW